MSRRAEEFKDILRNEDILVESEEEKLFPSERADEPEGIPPEAKGIKEKTEHAVSSCPEELTEEELKRIHTQEVLAKTDNTLSQLADRLATNSFQG